MQRKRPMRIPKLYLAATGTMLATSAGLAALYWYGPLRFEAATMFRLQATAALVILGVGLPAFGVSSKSMWRLHLWMRSLKIAVVAAVAIYLVAGSVAAHLNAEGMSGPIAWAASLALCGIGTIAISYLFLGAPRLDEDQPLQGPLIGSHKAKSIAAPEPEAGGHIGALRPGEKWLRGAIVLPAPRQPVARGQLSVGGIPLGWSTETQHVFLTGASGTGKTQIAECFLRAIRERAELGTAKPPRVIVLDPGGAYYSRFGRQGDLLLNPFDARSVAWSPFAELERPEDYNRLAAAFCPPMEGPGKEWQTYARKVFSDTLSALVRSGERDCGKLFSLLDGPPDELAHLLERSGTHGMTGAGNERMFANAKATLAPSIEALRYLEADGDFSVRKWVREGDAQDDPGWLFLTYRDDQMKLLRQFVAALADLAILETLSLSTNERLHASRHRRLFFLLDELDSLGAVSELKDALTKLRKFGGCCILGIQTVAQLRAVYGKETAQAILGNVSTRAILRPQDGETAQEMERLLGEQDIERRTFVTSENRGDSSSGLLSGMQTQTSSGISRNEQRSVVTRKAVLASELQALPNLRGVLMRPASPHHPFRIDYCEMPQIHKPYTPKE